MPPTNSLSFAIQLVMQCDGVIPSSVPTCSAKSRGVVVFAIDCYTLPLPPLLAHTCISFCSSPNIGRSEKFFILITPRNSSERPRSDGVIFGIYRPIAVGELSPLCYNRDVRDCWCLGIIPLEQCARDESTLVPGAEEAGVSRSGGLTASRLHRLAPLRG